MAFFGVTQAGYQAPIREHVAEPHYSPQFLFHSGLYRDKSNFDKLPPLTSTDGPTSRPSSNKNSDWSATRERSAARLKDMREKHARSAAEQKDVYRYPVVTSQEIGYWRKSEPLPINEPWTVVPRRVFRKSEMTRFVDQMTLTNREFSLF